MADFNAGPGMRFGRVKVRGAVRRRASGLGSVAMSLAVILGGPTPALAGVGLAVVLDLPPVVRIGESGVGGSLTITNVNTGRDEQAKDLVSHITLTPSCGSHEISGGCPEGFEDPGIFAIDSPAIGRGGTACDGTEFTVTVTDAGSGEVTFDPPGGSITLGPATDPPNASQCIIDFTFSATAFPTGDPASTTEGSGVETTAHAGASAVRTSGWGKGMGGNSTTWEVQ